MIFTAFLALVERARGNPFPINTDTTIHTVGYTDVASTAEGWMAAWGEIKGTSTRRVKVRALDFSGVGIDAEQTATTTNSWKWEHPAIDCDGNACMVSWKVTAHVTSRFIRSLPSGLSMNTAVSDFGSDSSRTRRPAVCCTGNDCTVGATRDRGSGRFAEAQLYTSGAKSGSEVQVSASQLDPDSDVQIARCGLGQVWLYSTLENSVVTARARKLPQDLLEDELTISDTTNLLRHRPQLSCLPSGVCAAGWSENGQPRWRLFNIIERTMLTGVISDLTTSVPNVDSVGVLLTDELVLRLWQTNATDFDLMAQWLDFKGAPTANAFSVTNSLLPMRFGAAKNATDVFVIWGDSSKSQVMGEIFPVPKLTTTTFPPTTTPPTTTPLTTTTVLVTPSVTTTPSATAPSSAAETSSVTTTPSTTTPSSTAATFSASVTTTTSATVLAPSITATLSSLGTTITSMFSSSGLEVTSTVESSLDTTNLSTDSTAITSPTSSRLPASSSTLSDRVSLVPSPSSGFPLGAIVGVVVGVVCSVFMTVGVVWRLLSRRKGESAPDTGLVSMDLDESDSQYQSLAITPQRTSEYASAPPMSDPANYDVLPPPLGSNDTDYTLASAPPNSQYGAAPPARESQYDQVDDELFA